MRAVVVWVPDWPVVAAVAEGLADPAGPVAVHDGRGLVVVSAAARRQGVRRGMRRRHAQRACPELVLLTRDEARDARAFEPVVQAVESVVAHPAVLRPGLVLAEAPVRHLGSEDQVAEALIGAVARLSGAEAYVGVATGLLTAILAARASAIVPESASAAFLAPHPVASLRHAALTRAARAEVDALLEVFAQLGIRTLGDLAALPAPDVSARFGQVGQRCHQLARGHAVPTAPGTRPPGSLAVARELDPPLERADAAAFAARTLAEDLAERAEGRACGRLRVTARTTDGVELSRLWTVESVLLPREVTDRVRWQLDGWLAGRSGVPPSAPLHFLQLSAEELRGSLTTQEPLWGRPTHSALQAQRAIVRLQGMLGTEGVWLPVLQGGRDPRSRVRTVAWNDDPVALRRLDAPWPGRLPTPAPSTLLDEPREVGVVDESGTTVVVDARGRISAPPRRVMADRPYDVVAWAGPWPISETWWSTPRRGAWVQVTPADGPSMLLVGQDGRWLLEGLYD